MSQTTHKPDSRALKAWMQLTPERKAELLKVCNKVPEIFDTKIDFLAGNVIQFDTTHKEPEKVVSVFFGMDVCDDSQYVYLFADEVPA